MPFFIPALIAIGAAVAGSGVARGQLAKQRLAKAHQEYESILYQLQPLKDRYDKVIGRIGQTGYRGMQALTEARKMLNPLQTAKLVEIRQSELQWRTISHSVRRSEELSLAFTSAIGVGTGAALAAGAWTAVATLGTASTGTAIATLHGAALTHATLASLGGGALAAGGGGMALGGVALASLAIIPAAAIIGYQTHSNANELNDDAEKLEAANRGNTRTMAAINKDLPILDALENRLSNETSMLVESVKTTYRSLNPLGKLSVFWRRLRAKFWGTYYNYQDMTHIENLGRSVDRYVSIFAPKK